MSCAQSPGTGVVYGVERTCAGLGVARSSFYSWRSRRLRGASEVTAKPKRRGPAPKVPDKDLLEHIRKDLEESLFKGEGHRKVHARLTKAKNLTVGRRRVLKVMRENHLLAPSRLPKASLVVHDGRISTDEPNVMWATDGARAVTVKDGNVWIFAAVEHWNAECLGCHVTKIGSRFAALEPVRQAVESQFGGVAADAARGVVLRHDCGSQYTSDDFQQEVRFLGLRASFAFVREPQTNGVVERFFRTLKEQVIYGRVYQDLAELRAAVQKFVNNYNGYWLLEKLGHLSPLQARTARESQALALAA